MAAVGMAACTTTYHVGSAADPVAVAAIDAAADRPRAFAVVKAPPPALDPLSGAYRVVGHDLGWLQVADHAGTARVPVAQLGSLSTFDRPHGAWDGALVGGALGVALGVAAAALQGTGVCADCPAQPTWLHHAWKYGAVTGLSFATVGALIGAAAGHEFRYQMPSARPGIDTGTEGLSRDRPTAP